MWLDYQYEIFGILAASIFFSVTQNKQYYLVFIGLNLFFFDMTRLQTCIYSFCFILLLSFFKLKDLTFTRSFHKSQYKNITSVSHLLISTIALVGLIYDKTRNMWVIYSIIFINGIFTVLNFITNQKNIKNKFLFMFCQTYKTYFSVCHTTGKFIEIQIGILLLNSAIFRLTNLKIFRIINAFDSLTLLSCKYSDKITIKLLLNLLPGVIVLTLFDEIDKIKIFTGLLMIIISPKINNYEQIGVTDKWLEDTYYYQDASINKYKLKYASNISNLLIGIGFYLIISEFSKINSNKIIDQQFVTKILSIFGLSYFIIKKKVFVEYEI